MNILVIKQTSLGDVLHISGHLRTLKENFPRSRLTLLTTPAAAEIYRHNPYVDATILFDHKAIKRDWRRRPLRVVGHVREVISQTRAPHFDLAFDLQGLARSVIFLYAARAVKKYVKGKWWGLHKFRAPELPAIAELDGVLRRAEVRVVNTAMEFFTSRAERVFVDALLARVNPEAKPLLIFSPRSRWAAKDWPLQNYAQLARDLSGEYAVVFCAAPDDRAMIARALHRMNAPAINLAGEISLPQFAELTSRARLMLCGDSFPMHLACAMRTPTVALFAPTDEHRTGPDGAQHRVIRAPNCLPCDRPRCPKKCLAGLPPEQVLRIVRARLTELRAAPGRGDKYN